MHHRQTLGPVFLGLLLLSPAGCGPAAKRSAVAPEAHARHMSRFSLLEHLAEAELRPAPKNRVEARLVKVGGAERPAIYAHAPAEIRFSSVPLYAGARLDFGVGIHDNARGKQGDGVRFAIRVDEGTGSPTEVWAREVLPEQGRWLDVELDLAAYAGRTVDLILATETLRHRRVDYSAWSRPVLRSQGGRVELQRLPVVRRVLLRQLVPGEPLEIELPARASLELAGQIRRTSALAPGVLGPVDFVASVDGRPVAARTLRTPARHASFAIEVPLHEHAGRTVVLSLDILPHAGADPDAIAAKWLRTAVFQESEVPRRHSTEGRNLLFVVVDTLRADHVGLYGYPRDTTPNLDRLAEDSLVFSQAISQSSWTMPATASLLTGLYPPEHGVTDGQSLAPGFETLAERLQEAGLTTFAVSANPVVGAGEGFHQGFERFLHLPWTRAEHVNDLFRDFLEEHRDLRWFAYLHYIDPHDPYEAPGGAAGAFVGEYGGPFSRQEDFKRLVEGVNFGRGEVRYSDEDIAYLRDAYDGEILYWDTQFGELIDSMRRLGVLENTILIVTSDHGEEFLEHGKLKHGLHLYDESIRVPLILRAPGLVEPGRRERQVETRALSDAAWNLMISASLPELGTGRELPAFSHTKHALLPDRPGRRTLAAVREPRWKYIAFVEEERFELYDLAGDPAETADAASRQPAVRSRYQELLERWLAARPPRADEAAPDAETMEKLRALGYIQ